MDDQDRDNHNAEDPSLIEDLPDKPSQAEGEDDETVEEIAERAKRMREGE